MADSNQPPASGATVIAGQGAPEAGAPPPVEARYSASVQEDALVGTVLSDRYKVLKRLGEGGMGTVYLAEHTTIRKKLALKVLSSEFAHKQDLVDRFLQEARAASMIDQENVVEITDFGSTPDGSVFFAMEMLHGEDLSDTVKRGALPWPRVKSIMLQICRALAAAHERGIIHRDMKPENCFRIKRGKNEDFIKVLDFGIAKVTSDEGEGKGLTRTGMIFGTPEYMSPEQAKGERPDHRVDVYATGVILYELLTGQVPFTADTFMGILTKHMFEAPPAPTTVAPHANIPPDVEAIILKALQKDKEYRFQSMDEMAEAIEVAGSGTAAVSVVSEHIARPNSGRTEFVGGGTNPPALGTYPPGTYPPGTGELGRAGANKNMVIAVLLGVIVLGGGAIAYALSSGEEAPTQELAAVAEPEPEPAEPKPEPEPVIEAPEPVKKVLPATAPKVTFMIATPGVDAKILDARDEGMYGQTNAEEGVRVEKSKEELHLILRADGYEDLEFSIVPNRDKTFTKELQKKRVVKRRKRPAKGDQPDTKPTAPVTKPVTKPATKPDSKPKKTKVINSPDLKDPFNRG